MSDGEGVRYARIAATNQALQEVQLIWAAVGVQELDVQSARQFITDIIGESTNEAGRAALTSVINAERSITLLYRHLSNVQTELRRFIQSL